MAKALTDLKIDAEWDLQVFSMSSVDDLLGELDKLEVRGLDRSIKLSRR